MNEGSGLLIEYSSMGTELDNLQENVEQFEDSISKMSACINRLCEGWVSEATKSYREDYQRTIENLNNTTEIVYQIIAHNRKYMAEMQATDSKYSNNNVVQ